MTEIERTEAGKGKIEILQLYLLPNFLILTLTFLKQLKLSNQLKHQKSLFLYMIPLCLDILILLLILTSPRISICLLFGFCCYLSYYGSLTHLTWSLLSNKSCHLCCLVISESILLMVAKMFLINTFLSCYSPDLRIRGVPMPMKLSINN